jgi:glutathione-independent formaldehyde dehydrogenase
VVGVYVPQDPEAATESAREGRIGFDFGTLFQKGQRIGTGQCPVRRYNAALRDLIIAGRATPSLLVSHELPLTAAPDAYDQFDKRTDGYTKVLLHP